MCIIFWQCAFRVCTVCLKNAPRSVIQCGNLWASYNVSTKSYWIYYHFFIETSSFESNKNGAAQFEIIVYPSRSVRKESPPSWKVSMQKIP